MAPTGGLPAGGSPGGSETILELFCADFGLLVERPEGHFGGHFGARVTKWSAYVVFLGAFWGD